ncbi:MAG: HNH endonuclease signature motif containing protein [Clostridia bacterium]|nr:HNH endonuclease signature motif containing protein [Clostridia bacterium]
MKGKQHKYTQSEIDFFIEFVPGHSYKEIQAEFIKRFSWDISLSQVKSLINRYGLNTGRTGCFEKGNIPWNKGLKGHCAKGSEKGWFGKGHIPQNHRAVGSERVNVDGYIEVKIAEPNKWRLKHRVVWEQEYGPLKKTDIIIFLDGNKINTDINNLAVINRGEHLILNSHKLRSNNADITNVGIGIAKLETAIRNKKKT